LFGNKIPISGHKVLRRWLSARQAVDQLVRWYSDVNAGNDKGHTALMMAAATGSLPQNSPVT